MKFLEDYKTLAQFKQANQGFGGLADEGDYVFLQQDLRELLSYNGVDVKKYPASTTFATLLQKYSEKEIYYGLATLWGKGQGNNEHVQHRGTYIVKFSDYQQTFQISRDADFFGKLDRVVDLARKVARGAESAFSQSENAILDAAMKHHFLLDRGDPLWGTVKQNYTNIRQHLDGVFRLAANKPGRGGAAAKGYVTFKPINEPSSASPYKTAYLKEPNSYFGSIHIDYATIPDPEWKDLGIAALIIHEASHKVCSTEDHAYVSEGVKYDNLSKTLRVDNADCYGFTAASVYAGKVFTEKMQAFSKD